MWLLWSALSRLAPSQQLGKRTCSRRNEPRASRAGRHRCSSGGTPDSAPQLQNVTRMPCGDRRGRVAGDHAQVVRERRHRRERAAAVVDRRALRGDRDDPSGRASAPSMRPCRQDACRSSDAARSDSYVEDAFVVRLPTNVCSCDAPAFPGKTIGSSGARWLKRQLSTKLTPLQVDARDVVTPSGFSPASAAGPRTTATTVRTPAAGDQERVLSRRTSPGRTMHFACRAKSDTETLRFLERSVTCR